MPPRTRGRVQRLAEINAEYQNGTDGQPSADDVPLPLLKSKKPQRITPKVTPHKARSVPRTRSKKPILGFGPKATLGNIDLGKFLSKETTWSELTKLQRATLKSMCLMDSVWGKSEEDQPTMGLLLYDMHWKTDVRLFQENLAAGLYKADWIKGAEQATQARVAGEFDDWKVKNFEAYWGQKARDEMTVKEQRVALLDLYMDGLLKSDDLWFYSRSFGKGKKLIQVECKFTMTEVDDYGKLSFRLEVLAGAASPTKRAFDQVDTGDEINAPRQSTRRSTKQVKIAEEHLVQILDKQPATIAADIKATDVLNELGHGALVAREYSSVLDADQSSVTTNILSEMVTTKQALKPILKKPTMEVILIVTDNLSELQRRLLLQDGRKQRPGMEDPWHYFKIQRNSQDIGSLDQIRRKYWQQQQVQNDSGEFPQQTGS